MTDWDVVSQLNRRPLSSLRGSADGSLAGSLDQIRQRLRTEGLQNEACGGLRLRLCGSAERALAEKQSQSNGHRAGKNDN